MLNLLIQQLLWFDSFYFTGLKASGRVDDFDLLCFLELLYIHF